MFAVVGAQNDGVTLKCADAGAAAMLIEVGLAEKAPYLPRGGWVFVRWSVMADDELRQRLTGSYLAVRRSLTRKLQRNLPPEPDAGA